MTATSPLTLSVCVPIYGQPADIVEGCLNSVCDAISAQDAVLVLCDGPLAFDRNVVSVQRPDQVSWIERAATGMVASWNACLDHASGDLVHIMHADDRVASSFYASARAVLTASPDVGAVATASGSYADAPPVRGHTQILTSSSTLRLLMGPHKPDAGAFVLRRSVVGDDRFRPTFPYCPDEEYFARLAARSRLAYVPAELYISRTHRTQARFTTWMQPDFVDVYVDARLSAAGALGYPDSHYARRETALRVVSVCAALLQMNQKPTAMHHLTRLIKRVPAARSMQRVRLMAALLRLPFGREAVRIARAVKHS